MIYLTIDSINQKKPQNSNVIAINFFGYNKDKKRTIYCKCLLCNNTFITTITGVATGRSKSCGCKRNENAKKSKQKYSQTIVHLKSVYHSMISRCYNKKDVSYHIYGFRKVRVCKEWRKSYQLFLDWALANGWKRGLHLDKDKKGNGLLYSPQTCCFLSIAESVRYRKVSILYDYNGETLCLSEICRIANKKYGTIYSRLQKNPDYSIYKLLESPQPKK